MVLKNDKIKFNCDEKGENCQTFCDKKVDKDCEIPTSIINIKLEGDLLESLFNEQNKQNLED